MTYGVDNPGISTFTRTPIVDNQQFTKDVKGPAKSTENQHTDTIKDTKYQENTAQQSIQTDDFIQNNKNMFNGNNSSGIKAPNIQVKSESILPSFLQKFLDKTSSKLHNAWQYMANTLGLARIELPPQRLEGLKFTPDNKVMQLLIHDRLTFNSANQVLLQICRTTEYKSNEVLYALLETKVLKEHVKLARTILDDVNKEMKWNPNSHTKPFIDSSRMNILEVASNFNRKVNTEFKAYTSWTPSPR